MHIKRYKKWHEQFDVWCLWASNFEKDGLNEYTFTYKKRSGGNMAKRKKEKKWGWFFQKYFQIQRVSVDTAETLGLAPVQWNLSVIRSSIPIAFRTSRKKQASRLYTKGWAGTVSEKLCNATSVESSNPGLPTQREIRDGQRGEKYSRIKKMLFLVTQAGTIEAVCIQHGDFV